MYLPNGRIGGEGQEVGAHFPVVVFDLEAYPEPKALLQEQLLALMKQFASTVKVARYIGASQAMVWDKLDGSKKWDLNQKKFIKIKKRRE